MGGATYAGRVQWREMPPYQVKEGHIALAQAKVISPASKDTKQMLPGKQKAQPANEDLDSPPGLPASRPPFLGLS